MVILSNKVHQQIYKMREQGVDSTVLNEIIESEFQLHQENSVDVIWDDDDLTENIDLASNYPSFISKKR